MTLLVQCTSQKQAPLPEEIIWFKNRDNFKDSTYEQVFREQMQLALQEKRWNDVAFLYREKGNALDYFFEYDSIYLKDCKQFYQNYKENIRDSFTVQLPYYIGSQYDFDGDVKNSDLWLKKAVANSNQPKKDRVVGFSYLILSEHKKIINQLDSSQLFAYKALEIFENSNDTINMGTVQSNLYRIKSTMGDEKGAEDALNKMIEYGKQTKDTLNLVVAYTTYSLRNSVTNKKKYDDYADTLNHIVNNWSQPNQYFQFLNAVMQAQKRIEEKKFEEAEQYISLADSLSVGQNPRTLSYLQVAKARYNYEKKGQFDQEIFEKWVKESIQQKDYYVVVNTLAILTDVKKEKGDYKAALNYHEQKFNYRDSIWNDELRSQLIEFEKKYETAKKEQQIAEQKQKLLQRNAIIGSLAGLLFLLTLASVAYSNMRRRKAAQREQQLQENFSQDLLQNTEDERSRIAGDLHDSVNHNLLTLKQKSQDGQMVTSKELEGVIQQVRSISYNLYPSMFEEVGLQKSIEELCRKVEEVSDLQIVTQMDYTRTLGAKQELQVYRIVEEALNNIMKHSEATHAMVKIASTSSELEVSVKDNGKGVSPAVLSGEKITFGMANMMQRAKSIQGKINLSSTEKGTELKLVVNS